MRSIVRPGFPFHLRSHSPTHATQLRLTPKHPTPSRRSSLSTEPARGPWMRSRAHRDTARLRPATSITWFPVITCESNRWQRDWWLHPDGHFKTLSTFVFRYSPHPCYHLRYDKTPVYPHQQHLPCAPSHEPLKSIYVFQRLLTTILLVPLWLIYYSTLPRSFSSRPSWSIIQVIIVKFTKQIYKVTEVVGVTSGTRDPTHEPDEKSLNETYFVWVPPLPNEL